MSTYAEPSSGKEAIAGSSQSSDSVTSSADSAALPVEASALSEGQVSDMEVSTDKATSKAETTEPSKAEQESPEQINAEQGPEEGRSDSFGGSFAAAASSMTAQAASLATSLRTSIREFVGRLSVYEPSSRSQEEPEQNQAADIKDRITGSLRERVMTRRLSSVKGGEARRGDDMEV